ncbi:geranylgeranylglyceryl/heptaprenylglyceryl phosphate synthase, partial [bacterium]
MSDKKIDMERYLKGILAQKGGGLFILIDPDRGSPLELAKLAALSAELGADAILIGSSILLNDDLSETVRSIKSTTGMPVFLFPGNGQQITPGVDGILFLSLISGRNPRWLIEEQVEAAPRIKAMGIPVLPTGYMIIESGRVTAVEFMSGTVPIPRDKPDIAAAHAIAAGMLGMKALFL